MVEGDCVGGAAPPEPPADSLPRSGLVLLWAVRIGIGLVLLTPLVVRMDFVFSWVVGKSLFARSIIEISFGFWAALVLFHPRYRPSRSWVLAAFAVWVLVSCLAAVFGVSPSRSMWSTYERMLGVFDQFHWFVFALMARSVLRSAGDWRMFLSFNLVSSTAVCAATLVHDYGLIDLAFMGNFTTNRAWSTLGNPLILGSYVTINALLGAALAVQTLERPAGPVARRIGRGAVGGLYALVVPVNLWTMWLSGTRTALAGLVAASVLLAVFALRKGGRFEVRRVLAAAVVLIVFAGVLFGLVATTAIIDSVVESSIMLRRMAVIGENESVKGRIDFAEAGLRAFLDRPLFGWGPENFVMAWGRHNNDSAVISDQVHNKPVDELATKGIVGLLSYLALWAALMSVVFLSLRDRSGRSLLYLRFIAAVLVAGFVMNLFQVETSVSMMQFSFLAALAASIESARRSPRPARRADVGHAPLVAANDGTGGPVGRAPFVVVGERGEWKQRRPGVDSAPAFSDPVPALSASVTESRTGLLAGLRASLERFAAGVPARPVKAGLALVLALAMLPLLHLNLRTASAASRAIMPSRPWSERLDDFARSIDGVPGLGNSAREYLLETASLGLGDMSDEEFQRTVDLVALELERGSAKEPLNWLLQVRATIFYQLATTRDRKYVEVARRHVDRAAELAPRLQLVVRLVDAQGGLEAGGRPALTAASPN